MVLESLEVGAIIGKKTGGYLTGWFAGERISHVGIYLGKYKHYNHAVIHADPVEGVVVDELYSWIETDYLEVWKKSVCYTVDEEKEILSLASVYEGCGYDYEGFSLTNSGKYCSELIVIILEAATKHGIQFHMSKRWWMTLYAPDSFIPTGSFFKALSVST